MNQKQWPINPRFLRRIFNNNTLKPTEDDLNSNGIFTKTSLQGFIAVITHDYKIDNSATLIEFLPKDLINQDIQEELIYFENFPKFYKSHIDECNILRTDSIGFRELNPVCQYFREVEGRTNKSCFKRDTLVLLNALKGIDKDNYSDIINDFLIKIPELQEFNIELKSNSSHPYFTYKCDITGFTETCFPIFFENLVIACLVVGGIIDNNLSHDKIVDNVTNYCVSCGFSIDREQIRDKTNQCLALNQRHLDYIFSQNLDSLPLEIRVNKIIEHIDILESRIEKRVNFHRYKYISENFKMVKTFLNQSLDSQIIEEDLPKIQRTLNKSLSMLDYAFPNKGFIIIFGVKDFLTPDILYPIAYIGNKAGINQYYFNKNATSDITASKVKLTFTNKEEPNLSFGLNRSGKFNVEFDNKKDVLRYFQTTSPKVSLVIWKQYDENWHFDSADQGISKIYTDAMLEFYTNVALNFSLFWGKKTEDRLSDIMRVTGHESRQILPRLKDTLESNFRYQYQIDYNLKNNLYHHKYEDLSIYLNLLNSVVERPNFLLKPIIADYSTFSVFEVLHKIRSLYSNEAIHRDKSILVKENYLDKEINVEADMELIIQVLYNLVDNAVKYSYRGSNIIMSLKNVDQKNIKISVTSYGPQIIEGDKIYDIYVRGKNIINYEDGLGIGMFICDKIIREAHNGKISHTSIYLSNYNIPCIDFYNRSNRKKYLVSSSDERRKIESEINNFDFEEIIAKSVKGNYRFDPVKETFDKEINRKTFTNTFNILLPKNK